MPAREESESKDPEFIPISEQNPFHVPRSTGGYCEVITWNRSLNLSALIKHQISEIVLRRGTSRLSPTRDRLTGLPISRIIGKTWL